LFTKKSRVGIAIVQGYHATGRRGWKRESWGLAVAAGNNGTPPPISGNSPIFKQ
jgi:hypothetical protein